MLVEEEYSCSDDAFEGEEHDEDLDIMPDSYRQQVILYRNFGTLSTRPSMAKQKSRRRRWTQRDMTNAYNAVKYQGMSLRGAATAFNVPESTLRDRVHGRVSLECSRPGPPTFFTFEEEKKMVDHILFMSKIGYPYTRNQVVELAGDMTKAVGRIAPFKYLNPSQAWFYAFLNRWPDLKNFLFGPRSNWKSKGVSGDAIQAYFEQLDKVLTKYGIKDKPEHMWIVDEVSISCENQPPRILPIGIQRSQSASYWNPTVAMIGAASAAGEKIPPFLIYRGESITTKMMEGAVRGTKFANSPSAWVNSDAFIQWFLKHFRPIVSKRPLILLYDGHLQFVSVRVLERAREDGVLLFPLPPHPAYNHCVENTCFVAFQHCFEKRQDRFFEKHSDQPLVKLNVAPVLTHAYERALNSANMIALFEKLGICPFNNLATSIGTYLHMAEDYDSLNPDSDPDGFPDQCGVGVNPQWPVSNINAFVEPTSGVFSMQNYSTQSHSSSYASAGNFSNSRLAQATPQIILSSGSSLLSRDDNQRFVKRPEPLSPQPNQHLQPASVKAEGQPTQQFSLPPRSGANGPCLSIRLQGPGAALIRPVIGKLESNTENLTHRTTSTCNSALSNRPVPSLAPSLQTPDDGTKSSAIEAGDVQPTVSIQAPNNVSDSATMQCYSTDSGFSASIADIPNCPVVQHMVLDDGEMIEGHFMDPEATAEIVDDIEEGDAPGVCAVCGQLEPPGFASQQFSGSTDDCQVVDWAYCDYCNRWVHLNNQCSRDAVIGDNAFMCALCHYDSEDKGQALGSGEISCSLADSFVPVYSAT
uniref:DDE-1 domain-containing protein n=1 Tax=Schistocephalus solidus TaxID=70667 RepID=A0A0X3PNR5_SCHSO